MFTILEIIPGYKRIFISMKNVRKFQKVWFKKTFMNLKKNIFPPAQKNPRFSKVQKMFMNFKIGKGENKNEKGKE